MQKRAREHGGDVYTRASRRTDAKILEKKRKEKLV